MKRSVLLALGLLVLSPSVWSLEQSREFNPAISVVFDGLYYHDDASGEGMERLEGVDNAFAGHDHGHGDGHGHGGLTRGFNLRESEITFTGNVDPYFDAWFTAALREDGVEIEEAWVRTQSLPAGIQLKAGRFLSAIGYHNEKHLHSWHFVDQNLAYRSLLGDHGLRGNGVQLSWLAPTTSFLELGVEALQGEELERFGARINAEETAQAIEAESGGTFSPEAEDLGLDNKAGPKLGMAWVRFGPNLGPRRGLQLGLSLAHHRDSQGFHEENGPDFFVTRGDSDLYGLQAVYKHFPTGDYGVGGWTLAAEYFRAESEQQAVFHTDSAELGTTVKQQQGAGYLEALYGFAPRWQLGLRHAATGFGAEIREGTERNDLDVSRRNSLALTFFPTEFSKLRLQYSHNDLRDGKDEAFDQLLLQYNLSLGAHGAHSF